MRKKKLLQIGAIIVAIPLGCIFVLIQFLKSDLNQSYSKADLEELTSEIKNTGELSDGFFKAFQKVNKITNTNSHLVNLLLNNNLGVCPCLWAAKINSLRRKNRSKILSNEFVLSWKIEKICTQKECLKYVSNKVDFLYGQTGIRNAAKFYFEKDLDILQEKELLSLVIIMENPVFFNPKNRQRNIDRRLSQIQEK